MGGASSSEAKPTPEQQQEESLAVSTGSLALLRAAFTALSHPTSNTIPLSSLHDLFSLAPKTLTLDPESPPIPDHFPVLLHHVGPSIASHFFAASDSEWMDLLRGYNRCCGRMPASDSLALLLRLYSSSCRAASIPCELEIDEDDGKVGGSFTASHLLMLLWLCWIMARAGKGIGGKGGGLVLPDVRHLVTSAFVSCGEVVDDEKVWECDLFGGDGGGRSVSAQKVLAWVISTAPGLVYCLSQFVQERLRACAASPTSEVDPVSSASDSAKTHDTHLLTCGRAWAISLTQRNTLGAELLEACFPETLTKTLDNLLYRSALHGKGLTRFWSNVEGYHGPLLILLSACPKDPSEPDISAKRWVIGVLTEQGLENSETFYGNSGHLYALSPIFRSLPPSGKEKNFVYCHLHPAMRAYEANPKPVGLAFGGTVGKERIFIDEDFATVTIRHHAVDKTYQPGSLTPNQGYLPAEATVMEVEVWGFGGRAAKEHQGAFKRREELFSEQRRTIDLKTFSNWEDSPEKMMMDMVSNPNSGQREAR